MASRFFSFVLALSLSKGCLFVFCTSALFAQETVNLVPNPSFEEFENGCPEDFHELPTGWSKWRSSPNSFSTCVEPLALTDSLGWAPWTGWGMQVPADGESYCGFAAFSPAPSISIPNDFREYVGCELEEPLQVGTTYYVSFKVSMGYYGNYYWVWWATNRIGAIFTTQSFLQGVNPMPIPNFAHVYTEDIITDTVDWVTISGSLVADSAYSHMALGVFFDFDSLSTFEMLPPNPPGNSLGSYYFIDDVCVSKYPDCQYIGISEKLREQSSLLVFPNPSSEVVKLSTDVVMIRLQIFSSDGKEVLSVHPNAQTFQLAVANWAQGIYHISAETRDNKTYREKLVIVR